MSVPRKRVPGDNKEKIRQFVLSKSLTLFNLTGSEKAHKLDFEGNVPLFTVQNGPNLTELKNLSS